ncbi:MAG: ABC transporter substrate-binding protein [Bacteroidales bacterium]|nr:ABC transporter substrate-binding protein [Bacteroidales bacterium]
MEKIRHATIVMMVSLLAVGCRVPDNSDRMIFRYNESAGIGTLDPAYAKDQALIWGCSQIYNGLIQLDTMLRPMPSIAKEWSISEDGKTYTFRLRDDVYFHKSELFGTADSSRRVVAGDVLYSYNRILDPKVASPGLWIFNEVAEDGFQAPDDSTFVIHLKQPFSPFLSLLAMPYCSVVPHEVVEHYGTDFRQHPCGTGPFKMQMWKEGVKLVLRKNEHYFERDEEGNPLPYLDAVAVTFIVDKQTAFLEFVKGNLDFMNSIAPSYKDEILTAKGGLRDKYADRITLTSTPFLNTEYLGFLMDGDDNPMKDKRIRQAINYGFDRRKMIKYMRNDVGRAGCQGFIPYGLPGYDSTAQFGYDYNVEKAKQLLSEAGYPGGKGLPTLKLATTSTYLDLCKYIQQQLGILGLDVKVEVNPPAALREQIAQSKSSWFRGSWIADYPDAENYLSLFYSPNHCPVGPNYTHFTSPKFDRLYERAKAEVDDSIRLRIYREMDSLIMDEAPVMVLYYDQVLHFTQKNVSGLRSNAMNTLDLRRVKIDNSPKKR